VNEKNLDKISRIKLKMKEDAKNVEMKVEGELWWIFQVRKSI
jgi:hypothetical protein